MKAKIVKKEILKEIELSGVEVNIDIYRGIDFSHYKKVMGYDYAEKYLEDRKNLKANLLSALNECDDFEIYSSESELYGKEVTLTTYKITVETDEELKKRCEKEYKKNKEASEKRKKAVEARERSLLKTLKNKYEKK